MQALVTSPIAHLVQQKHLIARAGIAARNGDEENLGVWARLLVTRLAFVAGHAAHAVFSDFFQRLPVDLVLGHDRHPTQSHRP
jgi:hypothetical protein